MRATRIASLALVFAAEGAAPAAAEVVTMVVGVHSSCPYGLIP